MLFHSYCTFHTKYNSLNSIPTLKLYYLVGEAKSEVSIMLFYYHMDSGEIYEHAVCAYVGEAE